MQEHFLKIWPLFIQKCSVRTFGERAVITESKQENNFLGSAESYKKLLGETIREYSENA